MALFIGIIGLPNVGKSTLFNALTHGQAEASNYPFCTVDPNVGVVEVPDARLWTLNDLLAPASCTPTHIRFVDIAGLVRGASRGEGLGNRFLGHIREADALLHLVRCFHDESIAHVDGDVDPIRDVETVEAELMLADLESAENAQGRLEKILRSDPRAPEKAESEVLIRVIDGLQREIPIYQMGLSGEAFQLLRGYAFLTAKPTLYLANVGEEDLPGGGACVEALRNRLGPDRVLAVSAQFEAELQDLSADERAEFLMDYGVTEPGLHRLVMAGYNLLNLITFYTLVNRKLRAWQLVSGTPAPEAAGQIHSDMERGFIRAEVAAYADLVEVGGFERLRGMGKVRTEGRGYVVQDGDVIEFLFKA